MVTTSELTLKSRGEGRLMGPFTYLVMITIKELGPSAAFGQKIGDTMTNRLRRVVDQAQVYIALKRLKNGGLLKDRVVNSTNLSLLM